MGKPLESCHPSLLMVIKVAACLTLDFHIGNDPSAGSPTETLLRLLLPLNDQV